MDYSTPGPIAVFDSGYGGLTVLEKMREVLKENAKRGWEKRRLDSRAWINNGVEEKMVLVEELPQYPDWVKGRKPKHG